MMKDKKLDDLRNVLTKSEKSITDLQMTYELLSQTPLKESFFKLIIGMGKDEAFLHQICKGLRYKFYPRGQTIFEEGDKETAYLYFIVKGQVGVYIKNVIQVAYEKAQESRQNTFSELKNKDFEKCKDSKALPFLKRRSCGTSLISSSMNRPSLVNSRPEDQTQKENNQLANSRKSLFYQNLKTDKSKMSLNEECRRYSLYQVVPKEPVKLHNNPAYDFMAFKNRSSNISLVMPRYDLQKDKRVSESTNQPTYNLSPSVTSLINLFNRIKLKNIFSPQNEADKSILQLFNEKYLNDKTKLDEGDLKLCVCRFGNKVRELNDWAIFGEKSQEISKPRTASIVALRNTEIIRIRQTDYQNIIKGALIAKKSKLIDFLITTLLLKKKPEQVKMIMETLPLVQKLKVKKGDIVAYQGNQIDNLFMIKKGELKISKIIKNEPESVYYQDFDINELQKTIEKLSGSEIAIGKSTSNEFLGEEFLFDENSKFEFNIECVSQSATLIYFQSKVLRTFPSRFQQMWKEVLVKKNEFRCGQFQRVIKLMLRTYNNKTTKNLKGPFVDSKVSMDAENQIKLGPLRDQFFSLKKYRSIGKRMNLAFKKYQSSLNIVDEEGVEDIRKRRENLRMKEISEMSLITDGSLLKINFMETQSIVETSNTAIPQSNKLPSMMRIQTICSNLINHKPTSFLIR
jgi:CRP-like cAMP-binding protein